jgi:hypothetical protein
VSGIFSNRIYKNIFTVQFQTSPWNVGSLSPVACIFLSRCFFRKKNSTDIDQADFDIYKVTIDISLLSGMLAIIEKIISRKYSTHIKSRI